MSVTERLTEDEIRALALGPTAVTAAMLATSKPGYLGIFKETFAGMKAIKNNAPTDPTGAELVRDLLAYAESHKDLANGLGASGDDKEADRAAAFTALDGAGVAAQKLAPDELTGYIGWLLAIARSMAEATSDTGEHVAVSAAEEQTIEEIERRIRRA